MKKKDEEEEAEGGDGDGTSAEMHLRPKPAHHAPLHPCRGQRPVARLQAAGRQLRLHPLPA